MKRVIIVGAGRGGQALLNLFFQAPAVKVVGVADIDERAVGFVIAKGLGIPVTTDYRQLIPSVPADLIIDATGNPEACREIYSLKSERTELIGPVGARLFWEFIEAQAQAKTLKERYRLALRELEQNSDSEFVIGDNPKMRQVAELIAKVAPTPTTVLIRGESGTGKELAARAIHRRSALSNFPLVTINCTALSAGLLESELFGYKRGAFTGASSDRIGLFEKADGGTVFLDEIGDMSPDTQAKLLRTLQTGEIRPVGEVRTKRISVRVIAATNRDLEYAIREGKFREDLFYRINTFTIALPPLRERIEDVPRLAVHFLDKARAKVNKMVEAISPAAMYHLRGYSWPGNLRELENVLERAVVLTVSSAIEPEHLPFHVQAIDAGETGRGFLEDKGRFIDRHERQEILNYLIESRGNITKAAAIAKVPRRTFHRLMAKHKFSARDYKSGS
ncbi:MAG: sigma 54-interacting transcriptional regulator [Deltaproteobacteria bacterium]